MFFVLLFSTSLQAEIANSDKNLKAAYCLKIVQDRIGTIKEIEKTDFFQSSPKIQELLNEEITNERRLQGYLALKYKQNELTLDALQFAGGRAEADLARLNQSCSKKMSKTPFAEMNAKELDRALKDINFCQAEFEKTEVSKRINSCNDLSWLPF